MDHTSLKRGVLEAARTHLENTLADLKGRILDLRSVTIGDANAESASQTESTKGSDVELMNLLGEQQVKVQRDLETLSTIDPAVHLNVVQFGAVVHTDQGNFLLATSMDDFDAGGKEYLGVSSKAPVMQELSGRKVGEKATVNGVTYSILDIC